MPQTINEFHSRAPSCLSAKEAKVCKTNSLPLLVFVVGAEGSRHHLMESLFGRLLSYYMSDWRPDYHLYDPNIGISDLSELFYTIVEKDVYKECFRHLEDLLNKAKVEKMGVAMIITSFPMGLGSGRFAMARFDLLALKKFECQLYKVRFLMSTFVKTCFLHKMKVCNEV